MAPKVYVQVRNVTYPPEIKRLGVISKKSGPNMMFRGIDTKYPEMIIRDIKEDLFSKMKHDSEILSSFSFIKKSKL